MMRRIVLIISVCFFLSQLKAIPVDTLLHEDRVKRSIYPKDTKKKKKLYNVLWGKHYRDLYTQSISVPPLTFDSFLGGVEVIDQAKRFHGLVLEDKQKRIYLLKPLGGSTSFLESSFFQEMYNKDDFKDTYMDRFIGDAYTIINPYTFIASDHMAKGLGLNSNNTRIYFIPENTTSYTVADGSQIQNKLVNVIDIPDINLKENILTTQELLQKIQENKSYVVDQRLYIRERLFDMLIGDWNKTPDNWMWESYYVNDSIIFSPHVIDRNHAFTKIDGFLFEQMLDVLSLGFIQNYRRKFKHLKKFNSLGFELDLAITAQTDESLWLEEANWLKENFTDELINDAFKCLPEGVECKETDKVKEILIIRKNNVEELARKYYRILQRNPIITGTTQDDYFVIDRTHPDSAHIQIYNLQNESKVFDKKYNKETAGELWIYGLEGDDHFTVSKSNGSPLEVILITGKGNNSYDIHSKEMLKLFSYTSEKQTFDSIPGIKPVFSDDEKVAGYDYKKTKYSNVSFSPWGFYDSDLGLNIGSFVTYTMYGYKRMPFTYQHRFGFNYLSGFMYRGVFPTYHKRKDFTLDVTLGFPKNYFNFFGFGNNTKGYKEERKNYNRINLLNFTVTPAFNYKIDTAQTLSFSTSFELIKVRHSKNRFINEFYPEDHRAFNTNHFIDLGLTYEFNKRHLSFLSKLEGLFSVGWKMNLEEARRNFPYMESKISTGIQITDRFSWATVAKGKTIFTDEYEFYQAATTELRGYRNNRFLGQYSFYQYSDFRLDLGELKNPFTPLKLGIFAGVDYGRVWYPEESSGKWHSSCGGGIWLTILNKITTKYSIFGSKDSTRFMFELGMGF